MHEIRFSTKIFCFAFTLDGTSFTDSDGRFKPEQGMPLMASRYRFMKVIGNGESAVLVKAEVNCLSHHFIHLFLFTASLVQEYNSISRKSLRL